MPELIMHFYKEENLKKEQKNLLRGLDKVHVEFGIVALVHNLLRVIAIRKLTFRVEPKKYKNKWEKRSFYNSVFFTDVIYKSEKKTLFWLNE
ncbi:hypothetical protein [Lederbergia graminis]